MKRASVIATVVLLSSALFAQVHGVPPSVTSFGPGRSMTPGVPASVTSLGPNANFVCSQPACANPYLPNYAPVISRSGHGHHHPIRGSNYYGYYGYGYGYIPYAYPVAVPVPVAPDDAVQAEDDAPDAPAPTVFERRPVVQPAPYTSDANAPSPQDSQNKHVNLTGASEEKVPVVVVFKDGHQQEIANGNYAIVGDTLYDLSGPISHKIKLADLDIPQTIALNEQRGVEFSLPANYKPQA